jgi:predicted TIM-barrel fold metal-dependent hydrolase
MLIADSQVHIWQADSPARPWPAPSPDLPAPHQPAPISAEMLIAGMDAAGVDRAVLISPIFEGTRNDYVLHAADTWPDRFTVMGRIDATTLPQDQWLTEINTHPRMRGLRFTFHRPPHRRLLVENLLEPLWLEMAAKNLPVMMMVAPADFGHVEQLAKRHPDLRIALDHLGLTKGTDEAAFSDFGALLALAHRPNISVKVSCLPHYTADAYPFTRLHSWLRQGVDAFGPQRMFWGSDLSRLPCSYRECVTMFTEHMPWLDHPSLELIMGQALCNWLDWPVE